MVVRSWRCVLDIFCPFTFTGPDAASQLARGRTSTVIEAVDTIRQNFQKTEIHEQATSTRIDLA